MWNRLNDRRLRTLAVDSATTSEEVRRTNGYACSSEYPPRSDGQRHRSDFGTGDLFAWGARQKRYRNTGSISVRDRGCASVGHGLKPSVQSLRHDRKFASYLYSGSFGGSTSPKAGHAVQRNRVIFMMIVGCLASFIAIRILIG